MRDPLSAHSEPPSVTALDGEVVVMGAGVSAAYTPDAASLIAERLLAAADAAREQAPGQAREDERIDALP